MRDFVTALLTMAAQGSVLALLIAALRFLLKKLKAPAWIRVLLWAAVAVRLLVPALPQTTVSVMPLQQTVSEYVEAFVPETAPAAQTSPDLPSATRPEGATYGESQEQAAEKRIPFGLSAAQLCFAVWALGTAGTLGWGAVSFLRLERKVHVSDKTGKNVYLCDAVQSPFLLGLIRPKIYVPSFLEGQALQNVLAHERAHIKRGDHLIKPFAFLLLAVYWFNPLFWLAYALLCRDIEYACDEKVLKTMAREEIAAYSETLLSFHAPGRAVSACPVAFGEAGVKQRVKAALSYKKPAFWILLTAVVAAAAVCVFFLTDRTSDLARVFPAEDKAVGEAVSAWLDARPYADAETLAAGHVLLGTQPTEDGLEAYVYYYHTGLCFENGVLTSGGVGGRGMGTFVLHKTASGGYTCAEVRLPKDGELYEASLSELMPASVLQKERIYAQALVDETDRQVKESAAAYLGSLGRDAEIVLKRRELPKRKLLTDVGVPLTAAERIDRDYPALWNYPDFIGTRECVEDGMRWVYETNADAQKGVITFIKRNYADGLVYAGTLLDFNTAELVDSLAYDMYPMTDTRFTEGALVYSSKAEGDLNGNGVPDTLYLCYLQDFYLLAVENGDAFACDCYKSNGETYELEPAANGAVHVKAHYFSDDGIIKYDVPVVYRDGSLLLEPAEDAFPQHAGTHLSFVAARLRFGVDAWTDENRNRVELENSGEFVTLSLGESTPAGLTLYYSRGGAGPTDPDLTVATGRYFRLQKFSGGVWRDLPVLTDRWAFTTEALLLPTEGEYVLPITWETGYGALPENAFGECYRVITNVSFGENGAMSNTVQMAAPFRISGSD